MLKSCRDDFNMQPVDVYAELNVKNAQGITETPAECYRRIASVRVK
jgi:hypothetical protein